MNDKLPTTDQTDELRPAERAHRLSMLQQANSVPDSPTTTRRTVWVMVVGTLLLLMLMPFLAITIWRLHGPQFKKLPDGWLQVTDREWRFECELPGWYTRNRRNGVTLYSSRFEGSGNSATIVAKPWRKKGNPNLSATSALIGEVENYRSQGDVTILIDESGDLKAPMIEFVCITGSAASPVTARRRLAIHGDSLVEVLIYFPEQLPDADVKRVFESIRWLK